MEWYREKGTTFELGVDPDYESLYKVANKIKNPVLRFPVRILEEILIDIDSSIFMFKVRGEIEDLGLVAKEMGNYATRAKTKASSYIRRR